MVNSKNSKFIKEREISNGESHKNKRSWRPNSFTNM